MQQPDSSGLVKLVTRLKPEAVVQLLGFKFQQHQVRGCGCVVWCLGEVQVHGAVTVGLKVQQY